jgi:hypothetical protein
LETKREKIRNGYTNMQTDRQTHREQCNLISLLLIFKVREVGKKIIGEPWFPGLTLKTILNWDLYWNKCTLYIKTEALLKHYYMYSTLFIEITQSI